jgi:hypothetical protein
VPDHTLVGHELPDASEYQRRKPEETVLYRVVQENLETFLASARDQGRVVPRFVERELRAFLDCGLLCRGFLRVRCDDCGRERLIAYSCKTRGFCPSCGARRMADTAAHLVDRVFPEAPVRQYVLSLPFALRYRLAFDQELCSDVLRIFVQTVFSSLKRRARKTLPMRKTYCGSASFVQRSGGSINLNPHFHSLILDGVYVSSAPYQPPRFHPLPPPTDPEVTRITATIARRLDKLLVGRGFLGEDAPADPDPLETEEPLLSQLYSASVQGRVATGPRAGQRVLRLGDRIDVEEVDAITGPRCASVQGWSLHANVAVAGRDRERLERLARYCARPPIATERLSELPDGRIAYRLRHRWRDGTTHVVFEPLDLVARLAALVPPPRANTVRYHGILASCAGWRDVAVRDRVEVFQAAPRSRSCPCEPTPATEKAHAQEPRMANQEEAGPSARRPATPASEKSTETAAALGERRRVSGTAPLRDRRLSWSQLLRRVFSVDVLQCDRCGGRMRIVAAIDQPEVIRAILECLGMNSRAPPLTPARSPEPTDLEFGFEEPSPGNEPDGEGW